MKPAEVLVIHALCDEVWPHSEREVDDERMALRILVWGEALASVTAAEAKQAVLSLAAEGREFAPSVGMIRKRALELRQQISGAGGPPSGAEAWAEILTLIQRRGYMSPPEICDCTHPAVHRAIEVFGWMNLCLSQTHMADRAHFIRFYDEVASRHRDHMSTPASHLSALLAPDPVGVLDAGDVGGEDGNPCES